MIRSLKLYISIDNFLQKAYIFQPLEITMYAVIEAGGKQHKVELGQVLEVDLMQEDLGTDYAFENVMLYVDGDDVLLFLLILIIHNWKYLNTLIYLIFLNCSGQNT